MLDSTCLTFYKLEGIFMHRHPTTPCHSQRAPDYLTFQMRKLRLGKVACLFQSATIPTRQLKDQNVRAYGSDSRAFAPSPSRQICWFITCVLAVK